MNPAYELFLLTDRLLQLNDGPAILELFVKGLNELFKPAMFGCRTDRKTNENVFLEIKAGGSSFGFLEISGWEHLAEESKLLIEKAAQTTAVLLARLEYEKRLEEEKRTAESKAADRLAELERRSRELGQAKTAAINLIEDLTAEIERRKKSEAMLAANEMKMRAIVEGTPQLFFYVQSTNGELVYVSPTVEKMTGYSTDEWKRRWDWFVTDAEINQRARETTWAHLHGEFKDLEEPIAFEIRHADGRTLIMEAYEYPLFEGGKFVGIAGVAHDVTARRRAEEALRESEERYRSLFYNNHAVMLLIDPEDGRIVDANPAAARFYGRSIEELKRMKITQINTLWPEQVKEEMERARTEQRNHFFFKHRLADGSVRDVEVFSGPIPLGGRSILYSIVHDITERRRAEESLIAGQALYQTIFEAAGTAMMIVEENNTILMVNNECKRVTGYSPQELIGTPWTLYVAPESLDLMMNYHKLRRINPSAVPAQYETILINKAGERRVTLLNVRLIPNTDRSVVSLLDVTELRRTETELKQRHRELAALYQISQQLLSLRSPQELAQKIIDVLEQTLEYSYCAVLLVDEPSGRLIPFALSAMRQGREFFDEDKKYILSQGLKIGKGLTGWSAQHGRSVLLGDVSRDPRYLPVRQGIRSELCVPLILEGRVLGVVNIESDRLNAYNENDQRLLESVAALFSVAIQNAELLEEVQKNAALLERRVAERTAELTALNKELESFSYSVSHDLRAPLRAVTGFAEILLQRHGEKLDDKGRRYLENIFKAGQRMEQLINELLSYSRLGRAAVRRLPVPLADLLKEVAEALIPQLEALHGSLEWPPEMPTVSADPVLLRQVFLNLLDNAVKYAKPEVPPKIRISTEKKQGRIVIRVSDNGIGIAPEYHEKIFHIFQRLHSHDKIPGTGIGLATVKKATELMGGSVSVESKPDEGSTFIIELPEA